MLRANELIWNYWVSNYLMGETPSAFDVLYWNGDGTGMTAQFNHDFSEFVENNPFVTAGAMKVRGTPISDLADLGIDSYVLGRRTIIYVSGRASIAAPRCSAAGASSCSAIAVTSRPSFVRRGIRRPASPPMRTSRVRRKSG